MKLVICDVCDVLHKAVPSVISMEVKIASHFIRQMFNSHYMNF
jgi:hypothetical protein